MATIKYKDGADWKYLPLGGPSSILMDTWHVVGSGGIEPGFAAGCGNRGAGDPSVAFRKYPEGRVRIRGSASTPSASSLIFTLPPGYRPPGFVRFPCIDPVGGTTTYCYVSSDGSVYKSSSGPTTVDLGLIEFDIETVTMFPMAGVGLPPRVTALPSSPSDGQEVYYVASAADGVLWHLKYNAGAASAYKWEFIGGPPFVRQNSGNFVTGGLSFAAMGGAEAHVSIPLAGDYVADYGAQISGLGAVAPNGPGVTATDDMSAVQATTGGNATVSRQHRLNALTVGTLDLYGKAVSGSVTILRTWICVTPVRVG